MDPANTCPRCGASRIANAPAGLCPRCLLGHGLLPWNARAQDSEIEAAGGVITGRWNQPAQSGILSTVERTVGPVPRVLLRDARTDERPAVASSEAIPTSAGDAGRYHLHGEIARGGMGLVLKGRDVDLGRDVAVKILLEKHRDSPEMVRRFVEEAQIAGQLQHPGICPGV